jgi:transcriptional regulator of acetoin/glycerol metabolism
MTPAATESRLPEPSPSPVDLRASIARLAEEIRRKQAQLAALEDAEHEQCLLPGRTWQEVRLEALAKSLKRNHGNREATARELGIARSTVFAEIRSFGIDVPPRSSGTYGAGVRREEPSFAAAPPGPDTQDDERCWLPGRTLADIETEVIAKSLRRHQGNREAAGRELAIARSTLFERIRARGIDIPPRPRLGVRAPRTTSLESQGPTSNDRSQAH